MAYATPQTVRQALSPDGTNAPGTAASLSDAQILDAISEATTELDGRLAARYKVPFPDPAPALIQAVVRDIAAYLATLTYRKGNPLLPDDPVRLRYSRASSMLTDIAAGKVELPAGGITVPETGGHAAVVNPYEGDLFELRDLGLYPARPGIGVPYGPSRGPWW